MNALPGSRATPALAARSVAAAASAAAGVLYLLIGLGMLKVGRSTTDGSTDLFGFGVLMAVVFAVVTLLLIRFRSRAVLTVVGSVLLTVLIGYFALANVRDPQFEMWGLLVKACQAVALLAVAYLFAIERGTSQLHSR